MVGWHHWLNEHAPLNSCLGNGQGQGSLACCSPWGRKGLDMTERVNKNRRSNLYNGLSPPLPSPLHLSSLLGEGNGNPFQYSCLENSMDRGAWQITVHGGHKKQSDTTEGRTSLLFLSSMLSPLSTGHPGLLTTTYICQVLSLLRDSTWHTLSLNGAQPTPSLPSSPFST